MAGKNTMTATMAILEAGFVMPNQLFMIGAKAMMGTELAAMAKGMVASLMIVQREVTRAVRIPAPQPTTNPPTADHRVALAALKRMDSPLAPMKICNSSENSARMLLGGGRMNSRMPSRCTPSSHAPRNMTATSRVGTSLWMRDRKLLRFTAYSSTWASRSTSRTSATSS